MSTTTTETKTAEGPFQWTTCAVPPTEFQLPKDFKLPPGLEPVPISQDSPTEVPQATSRDYSDVRSHFQISNLSLFSQKQYKYKHFLPYNTVTSEKALEPYDHVDPGSRADPSKKSLFSVIQNRRDMTPNIGTEIKDCQLSSLSN